MDREPVNAPLVSVIIPAFQAAAYIGDTLSSAQRQTLEDIEILVVDDGSTDNTADIVQAVAHRDPRVRRIRQENAGGAAARNRGRTMPASASWPGPVTLKRRTWTGAAPAGQRAAASASSRSSTARFEAA